ETVSGSPAPRGRLARRAADAHALCGGRRTRCASGARRRNAGDRRGLRIPRRRPSGDPVGRGCDRRIARRRASVDPRALARSRDGSRLVNRLPSPLRRRLLKLLAAAPLAASVRGTAGVRPSNRLLVLVFLYGGNDGYNTWVPYADPLYYRV